MHHLTSGRETENCECEYVSACVREGCEPYARIIGVIPPKHSKYLGREFRHQGTGDFPITAARHNNVCWVTPFAFKFSEIANEHHEPLLLKFDKVIIAILIKSD